MCLKFALCKDLNIWSSWWKEENNVIELQTIGGALGGQPGGPGGYNQQYPGWGPPAQQPQPGAPYHQPYQPHMPADPSMFFSMLSFFLPLYD